MGRITSYPETTELGANDIFLVDGSNGTRKVSAPNAASELSKLDGDAYRLTARLNGADFGATAIPNGANLNTSDYIRQGRYYCGSNEAVATYQNCPVLVPFMMEVISTISPNLDDESTGVWVYRLRKITTVTGHILYQYIYSQDTAGIFEYDTWREVAMSDSTEIISSDMIKLPSVTTITGDFASIATWIDSNYVLGRTISALVTPSGSGYFENLPFEIRATMTSSTDGWATLISNNYARVVVFGRKMSGTWQWFAPSLANVSDGSKGDYFGGNEYAQTANTWVDTISHSVTAAGVYNIHAVQSNENSYPLGIAIYSLDSESKLHIYGSTERPNSSEGRLGLSNVLSSISVSATVYLDANTTIRVRTKGSAAGNNNVSLRITHIG